MPPAAKPTRILTGLSNLSCAAAGVATGERGGQHREDGGERRGAEIHGVLPDIGVSAPRAIGARLVKYTRTGRASAPRDDVRSCTTGRCGRAGATAPPTRCRAPCGPDARTGARPCAPPPAAASTSCGAAGHRADLRLAGALEVVHEVERVGDRRAAGEQAVVAQDHRVVRARGRGRAAAARRQVERDALVVVIGEAAGEAHRVLRERQQPVLLRRDREARAPCACGSRSRRRGARRGSRCGSRSRPD